MKQQLGLPMKRIVAFLLSVPPCLLSNNVIAHAFVHPPAASSSCCSGGNIIIFPHHNSACSGRTSSSSLYSSEVIATAAPAESCSDDDNNNSKNNSVQLDPKEAVKLFGRLAEKYISELLLFDHGILVCIFVLFPDPKVYASSSPSHHNTSVGRVCGNVLLLCMLRYGSSLCGTVIICLRTIS